MSTRTIRGPFPEFGYKAGAAGCRRGVVLVQGSSNQTAVPATAIGQGKYRGIQIDEGVLPDGSANYAQDASHPAEMVNAQKEGVAWGLAAANTSPAAGDQVVSNASGQVISRVPFSTSAFVLGQFDEGATVGSNPQFVGVEMFPQYQEVVRSVKAGCAGALTADTKYLGDVVDAKAAAQVKLYLARFTGETIRNLGASLQTAPGGADTVIFTVQKSSDQGATWSDTALTCTISAAGKKASDLTHSAALAADDLLAVKVVSSAGTAADAFVTFDVT